MPDAKLLLGIDLARVRSSPVGDLLRTGIETGMQQSERGAAIRNLFGQMGFNPSSRIFRRL